MGEEIEVTTATIEAGAEYLAPRLVDGTDADQVASEVLAVMMQARRQPCP